MQLNSETAPAKDTGKRDVAAISSQQALDMAREQLAAITAEREQIIAKKDAASAKLKSVALGAFRRDAGAIKSQKAARAEFEDAEFALSDIDLAVTAAQESIGQCEARVRDEALKKCWDEVLALGLCRAEKWQRVQKLIEEINAEGADIKKIGEAIRVALVQTIRLRPMGREPLDVVNLGIRYPGNDISNLAALIAENVSQNVYMAWPPHKTGQGVGLAERERKYWQGFFKAANGTGRLHGF